MLALGLLRVICLVVGWLVLLQRARTSPAERRVWSSHAAAVAVLAVGATTHLTLEFAGVPARWAIAAFAVSTLPACLLVYRGLAIYHRIHSTTGEIADWLVALSCMLATTAVANLLLQTDLLHSPLSGLELQYRLMTFGAVAVVLATLVRVAQASGVARTRVTLLLTLSLLAVLVVQVWVVVVDLSPLARVVASFAWISFAAALAYSGFRGDDLPRPISTSPLSVTATSFAVLLASVAVITATTLQPGDGELRWSVVWAVLAVLGLASRISRLVQRLVHHDRVSREAATDELTGLANRRTFTAALDAATRGRRPATVLLIDLNRFKEVNDRYGHTTGDRLLQHVGRGFTRALPTGALLARLGGDEFAVLLTAAPDAGDEIRSRQIAHRLSAATAADPLDGVHAVVASVGVVTTDGLQELRGEELLRRADVAMYVAKAAGGGVSAHDEVAARRLRRRTVLTADLLTAFSGETADEGAGHVARERFEVHYQPQFALDGSIVGAEALLRWQHPTLGTLEPQEFLGIAGELRLLHELTSHVLLRAAEDLATWREEGHDVRLSFNVAAGQLTDPRLLELLDRVVARGTDPGLLVVEITEAMLATDPDGAARTCREIDARGLELSIDDFGTGWSSLAHLANLPVDEVKIDGSLIARVLDDPRAAAVVTGAVDLAHHLGLRVVAEGVEDESTLRFLQEVGCDLSQGFLHSYPVRAAELGLPRAVPAPR